jgi:hypothetical protein
MSKASQLVDNPSNLLRTEIDRLQGVRAQFDPLRAQHASNVSGAFQRERRDLVGGTAQALARQDLRVPGSFRGNLASAVQRMRSRQGVVNRGEAAIRNQNLRDRIAIARGDAMRRGRLQESMQRAANIREGVNVGVSNANQVIAESNADLFGGLAGLTVGALRNDNFRSNVGNFFGNIFNRNTSQMPGPAPPPPPIPEAS